MVDPSGGHLVATLAAPNVYELGFSPLGTFLITWQRPSKDEEGNATKNLMVWRTVEPNATDSTRSVVGEFVQKSQTGWNLQYTSDEQLCARAVTNEVQFFSSGDLGTVWNRLRVEGVTDFAIAPGKDHAVAVFVPERKVCPRTTSIISVDELLPNTFPCSLTFPIRANPRPSSYTRFLNSRFLYLKRLFTRETKCNSNGTSLVVA